MTPNLIYQLLDLAIALVRAIPRANIERTLLDIVQKSVAAYEEQTGKPLDPRLITVEGHI